MAKVTTNDGVALHFDVAGSGAPLVLVHGWNQTAALFERQVAGLSDRFRVITFDLRGHGESERPDHGYRMSRYAMDLRTVIDEVAGSTAHVLGHSMGCCVLWSYFDLFAGDGIDRVVFVDMMTHPIANPVFDEQEVANYGSILSAEAFFGIVNGLAGGAAGQIVPELLSGMVTPNISDRGHGLVAGGERTHAGSTLGQGVLFGHPGGLARRAPSNQSARPLHRRRGVVRARLGDALGRRANPRCFLRVLRTRRGRQPLHVHREPGSVQPGRCRLSVHRQPVKPTRGEL